MAAPERKRMMPARQDYGGARRARQWPVRLVGSLFGLAAGLVGLWSLLGGADLSALERERSVGFGVAALVVGAVALLGSLGVRDARALWYCSPRRWAPFRADVLDEREDNGPAAPPRRLRPTDDANAGP
jgi:hypothetical protein